MRVLPVVWAVLINHNPTHVVDFKKGICRPLQMSLEFDFITVFIVVFLIKT
jgi:hypothetical protein